MVMMMKMMMMMMMMIAIVYIYNNCDIIFILVPCINDNLIDMYVEKIYAQVSD